MNRRFVRNVTLFLLLLGATGSGVWWWAVQEELRQADRLFLAGRYTYASHRYADLALRGRGPAASLGLARSYYALGEYDAALATLPALEKAGGDWQAAATLLRGLIAEARGEGGSELLSAAAATANQPLKQIAQWRNFEAAWRHTNFQHPQPPPRQIAAVAVAEAAPSQPGWDFIPFDGKTINQRLIYYKAMYETGVQPTAELTATINNLAAINLPELQPRTATLRAGLGEVLLAEKSGATEATTALLLGQAYIGVGECGLARRQLDRAIGLDGKLATAYAWLGYCQQAVADWSLAGQDFAKAIELDPKLTLAYRLRASHYLKRPKADRSQRDSDFAAALADLERVQAAGGADADLYRLYVALAEEVGDHNSALGYLQVIAALPGAPPDAQAAVARYHFDHAYAICGSGLTAARKADQNTAAGLDALAWGEYVCKQGDISSQIERLQRATELAPREPRYRYHLGITLATASRRPEANDQLVWAIDLDPKGAWGQRARAEIR